MEKNFLFFDPNKSFLKLPVVWFFIFAILAVSFWCFYQIIENSNLVSDKSYAGFNNFFVIFKVPVLIASSLIPIITLLALFHKSEQSKVQNDFSNYYKHIEEFTNYINLFGDGKFKVDVRKLHRRLYPMSKQGYLMISNEIISKLESDIVIMIDFMREMSFIDEDNISEKYKSSLSLYEKMNDLSNFIYLEFDVIVLYKKEPCNVDMLTLCINTLYSNLIILNVLSYVLDFDGLDVLSRDNYKILNSININDITKKLRRMLRSATDECGAPKLLFDLDNDYDRTIKLLLDFRNIINEIISV